MVPDSKLVIWYGDSVVGVGTPSIYYSPSLKLSLGALAEYIAAPAANVALTPPNVTQIEASGISLASQTAWGGLFDCDHLESGQTVFINGGSSAVGAYAIQIAKAKGIKVWTAASGRNEDLVRGLGADEVRKNNSFHFAVLISERSSLITPSNPSTRLC